jgi:hypothetical protein
MRKQARRMAGKAQSASQVNTWRAFATPNAVRLAGFQQRINDSGH